MIIDNRKIIVAKFDTDINFIILSKFKMNRDKNCVYISYNLITKISAKIESLSKCLSLLLWKPKLKFKTLSFLTVIVVKLFLRTCLS